MNWKLLISILGFKAKNGASNIYEKKYYESSYSIEIDLKNKSINYGNLIQAGSKTTQNFSQPENAVVLECVDRLLTKGYKPQNLILEKVYPAGHGHSGRLDICVNNDDGSEYLLIECKTYGKEFDKELGNINKNGGQLFTYFKFSNKASVLMLYTSKVEKDKIEYKNEIVKIEEDYKTGDVKDFYDKWNKLTKDNGIFDSWVKPYCFESKALIKSQLKPITQNDSSFIFNQFAEILRHNVVSDKGNAFNKIFTLFLCKVYDETSTRDDEELKFQWLEGIDDHVSFQLRLTDLYKKGMEVFLSRVVSDFNQEEFNNKYKTLQQDVKEQLLKEINTLRLEKNNEFAIKEVYDHDSFLENAKIVKEVVELLQGYRIRYNKRQQYLSDFFELLLTTGLKQETGQFFTPVPIAQFIIKSLPLDNIVDEKLNSKDGELLPYMIDYAAGSGHFITEYMHEVQNIINEKEPTKYIDRTSKKIKTWKDDQYDWATDYVYGIEKDYRLVKVGKVGCYLHGDGLANVILSDGLGNFVKTKDYKGRLKKDDDGSKDNQKFDIILSNPPYAVNGFRQTTRDFYTEEDFELYDYLTDKSKEIESLFIERTKQLLKDGGIAGIILPSSILNTGTNTSIYTKAREVLLKYFEIIGITELGQKTFIATNTNTVVLFLRRRNNYDCINLQKSIDKFFETLNDVTINNIESPVAKYVNYVFDDVTIDDYLTLLNKQPNENIKKHDIYKEYKQKIKSKKEDEFLNKVIEIEKEKLYYFILCYSQKVVIVKTGEKDKEKQFLGYYISDRDGQQGIHPIQKSKTIEECTKLFDINSFVNPQKASTYIYKAFNGDFDFEIDETLKENISRINLIDMMTFDRVDFEKVVNTKSKKKVKIESKYPITTLENVCESIVAGGDAPQIYSKEKNDNYSVPIYSNGTDENSLYGYTNVEKVKKDSLSISARGTIGYAKIRKAPFYPIVRLIVATPNLKKIKLKYLESIVKNLDIDKSGATTPQLTVPMIKTLKLPLPPLDIQQKIVDEIEEVEKTSIDSQKIITNNSEHIDKCINDLSIYNQEKLTNLILLNEQTFNPKGFNQEYFTYIDIESVENGTGKIILDKKIESQKAPLRARRIVLDESVVISTVRPYLKAFTYIEKERENTIFSTGFAIIRSKNKEVLLSKYLYYLFMYSNNLMEQMKIAMPKGQYPSINEDDIKNFSIPVPPLEEQRKIVYKIEKLEQEINKAQQIIDESKNKKQEILKKYL